MAFAVYSAHNITVIIITQKPIIIVLFSKSCRKLWIVYIGVILGYIGLSFNLIPVYPNMIRVAK